MLYPDLNDLVALKDRKWGLKSLASRSVKSTVAGQHGSSFRGQGLEFDAVRHYVPGDDIRNIDWRVTARAGKPHLKIFKEERERQVLIAVDSNESMRFGTRNTFKSLQAAYTAAILGWQALARQDRVSGCLFGMADATESNGIRLFPSKRTRTAFHGFLQALSNKDPASDQRVNLTSVLNSILLTVQTGSLIYLISDFMHIHEENADLEIALSRLCKKCEVVFIAINDPSDREIFSLDHIGFCNRLFEKVYLATDHKEGQEAYKEEWQKTRDQLQMLTYSYRIPLINLSTETHLQLELAQLMKSNFRKRKT